MPFLSLPRRFWRRGGDYFVPFFSRFMSRALANVNHRARQGFVMDPNISQGPYGVDVDGQHTQYHEPAALVQDL